MENYEQKYKKALGWMRSLYTGLHGKTREEAEAHFPELKESEDERIRKELYDFITCQYGSIDDIHYHSWISWITKHRQETIEQDTEIHDLWVYIREFIDKFGRLPKDEDELAACIDYVMKRQKPADKIEQKSTWSEKHIADVFENVGLAKIVREQGNDQLTNAVQSAMIELSKQQKLAEWSEQDEKFLNYAISLTDDAQIKNFLKSLKPQPKQEWSEEDEKLYISALWHVKNSCGNGSKDSGEYEVYNWLKSLKDRVQPQLHWKPSKEQLEALKYFISFHKPQANATVEWWEEFKNLESLYNDLKSL